MSTYGLRADRDKSGVAFDTSRPDAVSLSVLPDLSDIAQAWRKLEKKAVCTVFQTHDWLSTWMDTVGTPEDVTARIAVGRKADGALAFIMPFQISNHGMTRVLGWLGGHHSNYQMGLYCPEWIAALDETGFRTVWQDVLAAIGPVDAVHFANQPMAWDGNANPFGALPSSPSANASFLLNLTPDFPALYESKRSSATRRNARKRDRRLAENGAIDFRCATEPAQADRVLDMLFEQKLARMDEMGVGDIYGPHFVHFLKNLSRAAGDGQPPLLCQYLTCGRETVATVVGAVFRNRYYGLLLSMTEGDLQKHSPGDLALRRTIEHACEAGLEQFDLSQGHADYKTAWADETIRQFDTIIPLTAIGRIYAARERLALSVKRTVKESPTLWPLAQAMRRSLHGRTAP